ncbi:hypothetical protein KQX54_015500 [Cotesia glomerata]|uniref:Uncharacterized protein n=1 Tax=Cotesia glomerata TaxID=32391 RepID=A0AAV7IUJ1_COTGL|nr:hypothetical protein KQX54_015500 [Cotesia glomerata]
MLILGLSVGIKLVWRARTSLGNCWRSVPLLRGPKLWHTGTRSAKTVEGRRNILLGEIGSTFYRLYRGESRGGGTTTTGPQDHAMIPFSALPGPHSTSATPIHNRPEPDVPYSKSTTEKKGVFGSSRPVQRPTDLSDLQKGFPGSFLIEKRFSGALKALCVSVCRYVCLGIAGRREVWVTKSVRGVFAGTFE